MNIKISALCLSLVFIANIAEAAPTQVQYKCSAAGCEIPCKTEQGNWQLYEKASNSVLTVNHDNGNVEFFIDDGANGKRTLLVSPKNLFCKVTGYY